MPFGPPGGTRVVDRHVPVQHRCRVTRCIDHTDHEVVLPIGHRRSVEPHVCADRRRTRLHVEECGKPIARLADVLAATPVFVQHRALHDLAVNAEQRLVDARARVGRAERDIARPAHRRRTRQFAAHIRRSRGSALFECQIRRVEVDDGRVAVGVTTPIRAVVGRHAAARGRGEQMRSQVLARGQRLGFREISGCPMAPDPLKHE